MRLYGWVGLLLLAVSHYCLFQAIEPFYSWFYCFAWWSFILLADNLLFLGILVWSAGLMALAVELYSYSRMHWLFTDNSNYYTTINVLRGFVYDMTQAGGFCLLVGFFCIRLHCRGRDYVKKLGRQITDVEIRMIQKESRNTGSRPN